ncbi:hypothetical protein [Microbacterium flavescens]|uniref:hypothetical protein n=1 Tax=Microbacterium flavescens TaxID=69366 RepID=UPI001BDE324C|nr:hypothetical protein [Microbacterium flavescens]
MNAVLKGVALVLAAIVTASVLASCATRSPAELEAPGLVRLEASPGVTSDVNSPESHTGALKAESDGSCGLMQLGYLMLEERGFDSLEAAVESWLQAQRNLAADRWDISGGMVSNQDIIDVGVAALDGLDDAESVAIEGAPWDETTVPAVAPDGTVLGRLVVAGWAKGYVVKDVHVSHESGVPC